MGSKVGAVTLALGLGLAALGLAEQASAQTFGLWVDNDIAAGEDEYYTNGVQLYYVTPERPVVGAIDWLADAVLGQEGPVTRRYGFALGQKIFTPRDLRRNPPSSNDRPYAGWLYGRLSLLTESPRQVDRVSLDLGVVGPWSLAEDTQKFVHRVLPGNIAPRGWGSQIENEPGVVLSAERAWKPERPTRIGPFEADLSPHLAGSLGNVFTFVGAGATLRFGMNMPPPVGALVVRPLTPIPYQDAVGEGFTWYLYASTEARLVARDIFLDGNSFRQSENVEKIPGVGTLQVGLTVKWTALSLTAAYNLTTPEFTGQQGIAKYGSLRIAFTF